MRFHRNEILFSISSPFFLSLSVECAETPTITVTGCCYAIQSITSTGKTLFVPIFVA